MIENAFVAIRRYFAGLSPVDRAAAIRRLAAAGWRDEGIADATGFSVGQIAEIRSEPGPQLTLPAEVIEPFVHAAREQFRAYAQLDQERAVCRMASASASPEQIAAGTGWSVERVRAVLALRGLTDSIDSRRH